MLLGKRGSRWRCLLVWASGSSTLGTLVVFVLPPFTRLWSVRAGLGGLPLDVALVGASAGVVLACAGWAWLVLTVVVAEAWVGVPAGRGRRRHLPSGVRRVVLAACGVALASGVSTSAYADAGAAARSDVALLSGLPLPDRAVAPPPRPRHPALPSPATVTVRPGDSLWSIAANDLPDDAGAAEITSRWHAIYDANRHLIGSDPDAVTPGQRLRLPREGRP